MDKCFWFRNPPVRFSSPRFHAFSANPGNTTMSTLVVAGYNDLYRAEEVRLTLIQLQKDYLIDREASP